MAKAKILCGDCGSPIAPGDTHCPACGAFVEFAPAGPDSGALPAKGGPEPVKQRRQGKRAAPDVRKGSGGSSRHFEPWQIVSGIALVALVACLIYIALPSGESRPAPSVQAPVQMPAISQDVEPLRREVAANPNNMDALLRLANALHDNRAFAAAVEEYRKYLAKVPENPDARVDLGVCYFELAQQDSSNSGPYFGMAINEMQTAAKRWPKHQPAAFNLAIVNLHLGNIEESNTWFRRAVELNKSSELGLRAQKILEQHSMIK